MPTQILDHSVHKGKVNFALCTILVLLGLVGNYFPLPLFFGVGLIFGSIAAFLALSLGGSVAGVCTMLIVSSYTYLLWGHPWAIVIFTAEILQVLWLKRRFGGSLVVWDLVYWLTLGPVLVFVFYGEVMGIPEGQVLLIALKQGVNGVLNVLVVEFILMGVFRYRCLTFTSLKQELPTLQWSVFHASLLLSSILAITPLVTDA